MTRLLVTSTANGTGKTAITVALATLVEERGGTAGYTKPKGTRLESTVGKTRDEDPMLARGVLGLEAEMHELEPVVYSPTFIQEAIRGREDPEALRERIHTNVEALAEGVDVMLLEGGDRVWTGGIVELTDVDVAAALDAEVVLVSGYTEPGDVDEVLATAERIGERLTGVLFNDVSAAEYDSLIEDAVPFLSGRGIETLGVVPHEEALAGVTVRGLADSLGADILTSDVSTGTRIERFSVGAMGREQALSSFRRTRNAAVITGGDRSDVQTAALEASGVDCLVLTGGHRPSGAVIGTAENRGVPTLLVRSDTRATVDRTETILRSGRVQRTEAVDRMAGLLEESVDLAGVFTPDRW